jgi:hypothetical protein
MMQIPCRGGITIYPHGGDLLALEVDYHPLLTRRLLAIPGVKLYQNGDHEKTFLFPAGVFEQVAEVVRPHRRPQLSEDQRQQARERLARNLAGCRVGPALDAPNQGDRPGDGPGPFQAGDPAQGRPEVA